MLCESPIAEKDAHEKKINQSLMNLLISPPIDLSDVSMGAAIKAITTLYHYIMKVKQSLEPSFLSSNV